MRRATTSVCLVLALNISAAQSTAAADDRSSWQPDSRSSAFDWNGFYAGGHIGGAWGDSRVTLEGESQFSVLTTFGEYVVKPDSFVGGFQAGYNWHVGNLVAGIQGEINFANGSDSALTTVRAGNTTYTETAHLRFGTFGAISGRLGLAAGRWMPYAKVGIAAGQVQTTADLSFDAFTATGQTNETRVGYLLGGGLDWAISNRWVLQTEYNYIDLGNFVSQSRNPAFDFPFVAQRYTLDMHVVKMGLNYRF